MRIAVISDIHGNRQAFESVLEAIDDDGVNAVWCLGDLVGYGAEPDACVAMAREACDVCLVGNHDLAVRGDIPLDEFSRGAELAARWTAETMLPENVAYLHELDAEQLTDEVGLYHASPRDPVWEYVLSTLLAELCLDVQQRRIGLIGHSHVALSFSRNEGEAATGETRHGGSVVDVSGGEWLLNPGSVGQPRDGDPRAAWLLLDLADKTADYRRTEYDIGSAMRAIRAARLPESLAERLEHGQ